MLSFRKYWKAMDREEAAAALLGLTGLILEALPRHAVPAEPEEHRRFHAQVAELQNRLTSEANTAAEMAAIGDRIAETYKDYNQAVQRWYAAQQGDLQDMVALLTGTLMQVWRGNDRAVANLSALEQRLRHASKIEDIRQIKSKLETCVTSVQNEVESQTRQQQDTSQALRTVAEHPAVRAAIEGRGADPITGLPTRSAAVEALSFAHETGNARYATPLVMSRLAAVRQRFGAEVAEASMAHLSGLIAKTLQPHDQLFRWSGPAFLLILHRDANPDAVAAEIGRIASSQTDCSLTIGGRTVALPVTIATLCFPLWSSPSARELIEKIDAFVLKNSG